MFLYKGAIGLALVFTPYITPIRHVPPPGSLGTLRLNLEIKKMAKKLEKTDGLGPREIKAIRTALRLVWSRSNARRICAQRCIGKDGFSYCEKCKKRAPKVYIDHVTACGEINGGYILRLFCGSDRLQGLCKPCHDIKTKYERKMAAALRDFY